MLEAERAGTRIGGSGRGNLEGNHPHPFLRERDRYREIASLFLERIRRHTLHARHVERISDTPLVFSAFSLTPESPSRSYMRTSALYV